MNIANVIQVSIWDEKVKRSSLRTLKITNIEGVALEKAKRV
jgi:hypothetical protein